MTEWQQVQDSNRLERQRPFLVLVDFCPERLQVGADMAMPMSHAFRLCCRAGCVNDFDNILGRCGFDSKCSDSRQIADSIERGRIDPQFCFGFRFDSPHEIFRKSEIDRNGDHSRCNTGPKYRYPFQSILGPDQNAVAFANPKLVEIVDGCADCSVELGVGRGKSAETTGPTYGLMVF